MWDGHTTIRAEVTSDRRTGIFDEVSALPVPTEPAAGRVGGHLGVLRDFVAAVRGGPPPETQGRDNIHSLAMTLGAIDSARRGQRVEIVI